MSAHIVQRDYDSLYVLREMINQATRISRNCRDKVSQTIEQTFPGGAFWALLQAPKELTDFQFACYLHLVRDSCDVANDAGLSLPDSRHFRFDVQVVDLAERTYRIVSGAQDTFDLANYQRGFALLRDTAKALCHILNAMVHRAFTNPVVLEDVYFSTLFFEILPGDTRATPSEMKHVFEVLMAGHYEQITTFPLVMVYLASTLKPEIAEALRDAMERTPFLSAA